MPERATLEITNARLLLLHRGLNSLDAVREGSETIGFEFSRDVKWRLTVAAVLVDNAREAFDRVDRETAKKSGTYDGMERSDENGKKKAAYDEAMQSVLDQKVTIPDMPRFTLAELLDRPPSDDKRARKVNQIAQSTLKALMPIIEEPT